MLLQHRHLKTAFQICVADNRLSCGAYTLLYTAFTCAIGYARFEVSGWADALRVKHGPELYRVFFCAACYVKERPTKSHFRIPPPYVKFKICFLLCC